MTTKGINAVRTSLRGAPPVVLVHPVGLDLTYWDGQIDAQCDTHDVVAFDLPGSLTLAAFDVPSNTTGLEQ